MHAQDIFDIVPDDYIWFGVSIKNVKLVSSDGVDGKANSRSCRLTPTLLESGKVLKSLSSSVYPGLLHMSLLLIGQHHTN